MDISTKDIANRLGVSPSTVSRALQGKLVSKETIRRVREVADELNYRPNIGARMMVSGRVGMYGLLVPSTINPYFGNAVEEFFNPSPFVKAITSTLGVYQEDIEEFRKYVAATGQGASRGWGYHFPHARCPHAGSAGGGGQRARADRADGEDAHRRNSLD